MSTKEDGNKSGADGKTAAMTVGALIGAAFGAAASMLVINRSRKSFAGGGHGGPPAGDGHGNTQAGGGHGGPPAGGGHHV